MRMLHSCTGVTTTPPDVLRRNADELIASISQMSNRDVPSIMCGVERFSPNELIQDLRDLTPRGIEWTDLHISAKETITRLKEEARQRNIKRWTTIVMVAGIAVLIFIPYTPAQIGGAVVSFFAITALAKK